MGRRGRARNVVLLAAFVVAAGAVVTSLTVDRAASAPRTAPGVEWRDDIAPIAQSVESIRGLRFQHTVPVRYVHAQTDVPSDVTVSARTRAALAQAIEPFVAFGLVNGQNDVAMLAGSGLQAAAGVYSSRVHTIRIYVPAQTVFGREVLAHELTHALEDQHFPQKDRPSSRSPSQAFAQLAVIEGSASLVEQRYAATQRGLSFLPDARSAVGSDAEDFARNWEWLAVVGGAQYVLGPWYIDATLARGEVSWDRLVSYPPLSDVVIVDPLATPGTLWQSTSSNSTSNPSSFRAPSALEVFLLFAGRVGPAAALDVVTHSSGATVTMYERDGRPCGDLVLGSATPDDPALAGTLDRWIAAAGPANASRSVVPRPAAAVLTSCRGVSVVPFGSFAVPLAQLAGRNAAIAGALRRGVDSTAAACIGRAVLADERYRSQLQHAIDARRSPPGDARTRAARRAAEECHANADVRSE
jgi:hypothetical protein